MQRDPFPGYPPYLEAAAAALGCPEAADPARRVSTLAALANLCAQAAVAEDRAVPIILAKAEEFRDQLRVAARAAELMLDSIREARYRPRSEVPLETWAAPHPPRSECASSQPNTQHHSRGRKRS